VQQKFREKVIRVLDGDTIEVLQDKKPVRIRLANIDAPERNRLSGAGQPISLKAWLQRCPSR
jgi:endonuclease YncB( thermonuclease family)